MNEKQRHRSTDLDLAHKGMIPWSAKEFNSMYAKYSTAKQKLGGNKEEDMFILVEVFRKQYTNELEFTAHIYRFHLIRRFIFKYAIDLIKDGFAATKGEAGFRNELMDILCTLPYSFEENGKNGDKTYTFLYSQVKAATLKKINVHLN